MALFIRREANFVSGVLEGDGQVEQGHNVADGGAGAHEYAHADCLAQFVRVPAALSYNRAVSGYRSRVAVIPMASVLANVGQRDDVNGIRIIGIDGPSGSGKSTLGKRLARLSGAPLIQIDDFVSWPDFAGWWPRFDDQVLAPLINGDAAHYQVRDWDNDEFGTSLNGWKTAEWASVVIVEGVTCTRWESATRLAYAIWVEAPAELRLQRGIERDGETHRHLWLRWMREEQAFFDNDRTRSRADLRVLGVSGVCQDPAAEVVVVVDDE
jgi:ABC-type dipeptide/oligopeptide/nickel transport system ATPase component